jgi:hypothetical protein
VAGCDAAKTTALACGQPPVHPVQHQHESAGAKEHADMVAHGGFATAFSDAAAGLGA